MKTIHSLELAELGALMMSLAQRIAAPETVLPTIGYSESSGRPHLEYDPRGYHYVVTERGQEFERVTSNDRSEILYQSFVWASWRLAWDYELHNRDRTKDGRRLMHSHQLELLTIIDEDWARRKRSEIDHRLQEVPYDDNIGLRVDYVGELRTKGVSHEEAVRIAYEKFPETTIA